MIYKSDLILASHSWPNLSLKKLSFQAETCLLISRPQLISKCLKVEPNIRLKTVKIVETAVETVENIETLETMEIVGTKETVDTVETVARL